MSRSWPHAQTKRSLHKWEETAAKMDGNPQSAGFTVEDDGKGEVIEIK